MIFSFLQSKKFIIISVIFIVAFLYINLSMVDYRGGRTSVSCSPDGIYKMQTVFPLPLGRGGPIFILTERATNNVLMIRKPPSDLFDLRHWWRYESEHSKELYFGYQYGGIDINDNTFKIPPSIFRRIQAWLIIKIHQLEDPQLQEKDAYDSVRTCADIPIQSLR